MAMAKFGSMLTMMLLGYEANNAIKEENTQENVVTHYEAKPVEIEQEFMNDHGIILCALIIVVVVMLLVKIYKKLVKDLSSSITTA